MGDGGEISADDVVKAVLHGLREGEDKFGVTVSVKQQSHFFKCVKTAISLG